MFASWFEKAARLSVWLSLISFMRAACASPSAASCFAKFWKLSRCTLPISITRFACASPRTAKFRACSARPAAAVSFCSRRIAVRFFASVSSVSSSLASTLCSLVSSSRAVCSIAPALSRKRDIEKAT